MCEDIGVTMVTNIISQLQENFPLRRAAGSFQISFKTFLSSSEFWLFEADDISRSSINVLISPL